jgi:hypothetical protein
LALEDPPPEFYEELVKSVAAFELAPALHNPSVDSFPLEELPEALMVAPIVFVRREGPNQLFMALYDGPYVVLQRMHIVSKI